MYKWQKIVLTSCTLSGSRKRAIVQTFHWVSSELQSVIAGGGGGMGLVVVGTANQIPLNGALEQEKPTLGSFEEVWKRFRRHCITASVCLSASVWVCIPVFVCVCARVRVLTHTLSRTVCAQFTSQMHKRKSSLWLTHAHSLSDQSSNSGLLGIFPNALHYWGWQVLDPCNPEHYLK